jgi:hypothetical protein
LPSGKKSVMSGKSIRYGARCREFIIRVVTNADIHSQVIELMRACRHSPFSCGNG